MKKYKIELIGANSDAIANAEDRKKFRKNMSDIGIDLPKSEILNNFNKAKQTLRKIGLPAIIRPSFTLGFAKKGEGARLVEEERSNYDGEIAINASGGLLSRGHPVGATGLLQTVEIVNQLRGEATGYQVPDAKIGLIETMGGAQPAMDGITCVVSILGK